MAKINRRDYLRKMAAGAGLLVAGDVLSIPAQKRKRPSRSRRNMPSHKPPKIATVGSQKPNLWLPDIATWPHPDDTCVKLIFMGLMGFTPKGNTCEIGFHLKNANQHKHQLSVQAYEQCNESGRWDVVSGNSININVQNPTVTGVSYYEPNRNAQTRAELSDKDFRWIIDFDSDYLYGKHFASGTHTLKKKGIYKPTLVLEHGVLYTQRKTASTFTAQTEDGTWVSDLGQVADVIAANIYLGSNGQITLKASGKPDLVVRAPGEVYFMNHCFRDDDHNECFHEPRNLADKTRRNDFYLNYQAFDYTQGMKEDEDVDEYQLYLHDSHPQTEPPGTCKRNAFDLLSDQEKMLTDESPCAAVGYGDAH